MLAEPINIIRADTPTFVVDPQLVDTRKTMVSYTVPWQDMPLLKFLERGNGAPRIYWANDNHPVKFAGFGIAAKLTAHSSDRFAVIQAKTKQLFSQMMVINGSTPSVVGPRLFGGFSFSAETDTQGLWSAFPAASFILPKFLFTQVDEGQSWLTVNLPVDLPDTRNPQALHRLLQREIAQMMDAPAKATGGVFAQSQPETEAVMSQQTWHQLVAEATHRIRRGDLDKVVLARARQLQSDGPIDPANALSQLSNRYPDCYRFLFEPTPGHAFYGATPELLAKVEGTTLRTVAMAGSIGRGDTPEADDELAHQLAANPKEQNEHALVVDAIKENMQSLVLDLRVPEEPEICRLSNIQHLKTAIEGTLTENCGILPVVEALHPTPAVGGRPRKLALEIINQVEPTPRGWYASPVGWIDHNGNGMFAVAIRSAVSVGNNSLLYAGAGIVADSIPEKEWRETQLKFKPLADALDGAAA